MSNNKLRRLSKLYWRKAETCMHSARRGGSCRHAEKSDACITLMVNVLKNVFVCSWEQEKNKVAAQELATMLLSMPAPSSVQQQTKSLLASLHTSRSAYHNHKVTWCKDFNVSWNLPVYGWGATHTQKAVAPCSVNLLANFPLAPAACLVGFCVSPELHYLKCFLKVLMANNVS